MKNKAKEVESSKGLRVHTPHGTLIAAITGDADYPGIQISLETNSLQGNEMLLTVVEYSETEHGCGYYPDRPWLMHRQKIEVPPARRGESWELDHRVTPGLQTRAYEKPTSDDEEQMHCTYHYGYPLPQATDSHDLAVSAVQPALENPDAEQILKLHDALVKTCNNVESLEDVLGIEYLRDGCNNDVEKAAVLIAKLRAAITEVDTDMLWQELVCGLSDSLMCNSITLDLAMSMSPENLLHVASAKAF